TGQDPSVVAATHAGFPVVDGVWSFLIGVRAMFRYRDFLSRGRAEVDGPRERIVASWRARLIDGTEIGEASALRMLEDFGIRTSKPVTADSRATTLEAARRCGYPVVLKIAGAEFVHKTDVGGVVLNVGNDAACAAAYQQLSASFGPKVLVAPMITGGVEMLLGAKTDPQFGPVIVIGFGGVHAEILRDVVLALPPIDAERTRRLLERLRLRPLLDGARGRSAVDVTAFCDTVAKFAALVSALDGRFAEIDVNPVIVNAHGATAVDAFVIATRNQ
ncbi:MAG: acetate--CoA ligase family protein, partial [Woeseiaceae bacterium]|nr:acetate--CoA ligase family protein [Woeseiaceae bacterium]